MSFIGRFWVTAEGIGTKICKLADALSKDSTDHKPLLATSNYDEEARPSSVEHIRCGNLDEESQKIIERLSVQLRAYPGESLGVISPTNEAVVRIWKHIEKAKLAPLASLHISGEHAPFEPDKPICVCTLHAVKGLEFRAMHIAGSEYLKKFQYQRNMAYTAVTRAKTSLSLYYSGDLPGYLEQALNILNPLPNLPELKAVFGKKK